MRIQTIHRLAALIALLALPAAVAAQGGLGSQGFGYPVGQMSGAALGSGGAGAESDPNSGINPAAIAQPNRFSLMLQFEPEFRRTSAGGAADKASLVRFPSFVATGSFGRFVVSGGVTTVLDRTWSNTYADSLLVGGAWVPTTVIAQSEGSLSDVRAALSYVVHRRLQLGFGLHGMTGENRTGLTYIFPDTSGVGGVDQAASFGYEGAALSFGFVAEPRDGLQLSGSMRSGGALTLEQGGSEVGAASVPTRFGLGATWAAIPGVAVSARVEQTRWSDMDGLGSTQVSLFDATEFALGAEFLGPRLGGTNSAVRVGIRDRALPFGISGNEVRERILAGGLGIPVSRGRAQIDLALQRATRSAPGITEKAWLITVGLGIRP
jgi:hypothetical protein